jgi:hypothetical protein
MFAANIESDHILITRQSVNGNEEVIKITDVESFNAFVDMYEEGETGLMCYSSMNHPFDSTTNMDLVLLANNLTGNTIYTPDSYYQPLPAIRDENGIPPNHYWIMEKNGIEAYPDIEESMWLCYYEEDIGEGVTVVLVDATPATLEIVTV